MLSESEKAAAAIFAVAAFLISPTGNSHEQSGD